MASQRVVYRKRQQAQPGWAAAAAAAMMKTVRELPSLVEVQGGVALQVAQEVLAGILFMVPPEAAEEEPETVEEMQAAMAGTLVNTPPVVEERVVPRELLGRMGQPELLVPERAAAAVAQAVQLGLVVLAVSQEAEAAAVEVEARALEAQVEMAAVGSCVFTVSNICHHSIFHPQTREGGLGSTRAIFTVPSGVLTAWTSTVARGR